MDLNAVHLLIKVAESRSFTQAATLLGTSQPRISRAVAQLEKDLGTRLLRRIRAASRSRLMAARWWTAAPR